MRLQQQVIILIQIFIRINRPEQIHRHRHLPIIKCIEQLQQLYDIRRVFTRQQCRVNENLLSFFLILNIFLRSSIVI